MPAPTSAPTTHSPQPTTGEREASLRRGRLAEQLAARNLDALVVAAAPNIRYLCGFTGSNGLLLVTRDSAILFTDPRYALQAAQETGPAQVLRLPPSAVRRPRSAAVRVVRGSLYPALMKAVARRRLRRIGFEQARISYETYEQLRDGLTLGASLEPAAGLVELLRIIKSKPEIEAIRRSVLTNSRALDRAVRKLRPGITESALAAEIEYQMRLLGAEKPAFETIVASGSHTALPHATPRDLRIERGLVLIDMGCSQEGYASDMTRMAFLGTPPARIRKLYRAVLEAQLAAADAVRPGITAGRVDRVARAVLQRFGYDRFFIHSTGHGLGLEIHEPPRLGKRDRTRLEPGMTITVEPGVYVEGYGGIRIEDTVLVTSTGHEVLTPTPKQLIVL